MTRDIDLVVGGSGKVGAALTAALRKRGAHVVTTGRTGSDGTDLALDFENPDFSVLPPGIARAYICAAMPGADLCAAEPERTYTVNVTTAVDLTRHLSVMGAFVLNLSSTQVFDGRERSVPPDAPHHPFSDYGRHKSALESLLGDTVSRPNAIVRISKILSPDDPGILARWRDALAEGRPVSAFRDRSMSPVTLRQAVDAMVAVAYGPWEGVSQISASDEISYFDAACVIAQIVGADTSLVCPISAGEAGGVVPPHHAGLDCRATEARLGWRFAGSEQVVKEVMGVKS